MDSVYILISVYIYFIISLYLLIEFLEIFFVAICCRTIRILTHLVKNQLSIFSMKFARVMLISHWSPLIYFASTDMFYTLCLLQLKLQRYYSIYFVCCVLYFVFMYSFYICVYFVYILYFGLYCVFVVKLCILDYIVYFG